MRIKILFLPFLGVKKKLNLFFDKIGLHYSVAVNDIRLFGTLKNWTRFQVFEDKTKPQRFKKSSSLNNLSYLYRYIFIKYIKLI